MTGLLMTRPPDAARRFVSGLPDALTAGLGVVYSPLIKVQSLGQVIDLNGIEAVIFTSANGVAVAAETLGKSGMLAYCLGQGTTLAAKKAGWQAEFCGLTAGDLVAGLLQRRPHRALLHLRGQHARGSVAGRLAAGGLSCGEQVIYDQPLLPLTAEALWALSEQSDIIVPLFSPRTARQFANLCPDDASIHLIAMSEAIADPLKTLNHKGLQICRKPDVATMTQLVRDVALRLIRVESRRSAQ